MVMLARRASATRKRPRLGRSAELTCLELVHVTQANSAGVPRTFHWRGRRYQVLRVEGGAEPPVDGPGPRLIRVRTASGMRCDLEYRSPAEVWMMRRVLTAGEGGQA
jgi:hypothetical protein